MGASLHFMTDSGQFDKQIHTVHSLTPMTPSPAVTSAFFYHGVTQQSNSESSCRAHQFQCVFFSASFIQGPPKTAPLPPSQSNSLRPFH